MTFSGPSQFYGLVTVYFYTVSEILWIMYFVIHKTKSILNFTINVITNQWEPGSELIHTSSKRYIMWQVLTTVFFSYEYRNQIPDLKIVDFFFHPFISLFTFNFCNICNSHNIFFVQITLFNTNLYQTLFNYIVFLRLSSNKIYIYITCECIFQLDCSESSL